MGGFLIPSVAWLAAKIDKASHEEVQDGSVSQSLISAGGMGKDTMRPKGDHHLDKGRDVSEQDDMDDRINSVKYFTKSLLSQRMLQPSSQWL